MHVAVCTNAVSLQSSFGKPPVPGFQVESAGVADSSLLVCNILFKIIKKRHGKK